MNLSARLNKLERIDNAGRVIVMWRRAGEDNVAAHARWCAEHPDQPAPSQDDTSIMIVKWADPDEGAPQ